MSPLMFPCNPPLWLIGFIMLLPIGLLLIIHALVYCFSSNQDYRRLDSKGNKKSFPKSFLKIYSRSPLWDWITTTKWGRISSLGTLAVLGLLIANSISKGHIFYILSSSRCSTCPDGIAGAVGLARNIIALLMGLPVFVALWFFRTIDTKDQLAKSDKQIELAQEQIRTGQIQNAQNILAKSLEFVFTKHYTIVEDANPRLQPPSPEEKKEANQKKIAFLQIVKIRSDNIYKDHFEDEILQILKDIDLNGIDLSNCNLKDANLKGTNLKGTNLEGTNLKDANLEGANLEGANLKDANLEGANLEDANLKDANLQTIKLPEDRKFPTTQLKGAILQGLDLNRLDFTGADFTGANFTSADLTGAILTNTNLTNADLQNTNLQTIKLPEDRKFPTTQLAGAKLQSLDLSGLDFTDDIQQSTPPENMHYRNTLVIGGGFPYHGANLKSAHLEGTNFTRANLAKINLLKAIFSSETKFDFAIMDEDTLVIGTSRSDNALTRAGITEWGEHNDCPELGWVSRKS